MIKGTMFQKFISDPAVFKELQYIVAESNNSTGGAPVQFINAEEVMDYIGQRVANGSWRPGSLELSRLSQIGIIVECGDCDGYRNRFGKPEQLKLEDPNMNENETYRAVNYMFWILVAACIIVAALTTSSTTWLISILLLVSSLLLRRWVTIMCIPARR